MSKNKKHHDICKICKSQCCQYYALQLDTPRSYDDFEKLKWFIVHENTKIFVDGKEWFLEVLNPCKHLTEDYHCSIYERRPKICRDYGITSEGEMECHGSEAHIRHDHYFDSIEQIEAFVKKRFSRKKKK